MVSLNLKTPPFSSVACIWGCVPNSSFLLLLFFGGGRGVAHINHHLSGLRDALHLVSLKHPSVPWVTDCLSLHPWKSLDGHGCCR